MKNTQNLYDNKYLESITDSSLSILNVLPCGILLFNTAGKITFSNRTILEMLGETWENLQGKDISDFITDTELLSSFKNGESFSNVLTNIGELYLFISCYVINEGKEIKEYVVKLSRYETVKDEQVKKAEEISNELNALIEASYDGIWISDGNGITLRVNKSYEQFSGIKREEVVGRSLYDLVKEGVYSDSAALHVIEKKTPVTLIHEIKTGKKAMVTATPVFDEKGNIWRIVTNVRDITLINDMRKELESLKQESIRYKQELQKLRYLNLDFEIIGCSEKLNEAIDLTYRAASVDSLVLVLGESGVGKDLVAKLIHKISARNEKPFLKINCGSIPENLLESELFGYEKGSFTGASRTGKPGMFELADEGTLFLDEIAELSLKLQVKLLQVIQEQKVYRVGGTEPLNLDVRIVAATNQDLEKMVEEGTFRKDLYYRLNVIPIRVPPLREREEDIALLINFFLQKYSKKFGIDKDVEEEAVRALVNYSWPGNIRELENLIQRLVVLGKEKTITKKDLPSYITGDYDKNITDGEYAAKNQETKSKNRYEICLSSDISLADALQEVEKKLISEALLQHGTTRKVAKKLNINQSTVVRKVRKYNIKT